MTVIQNVNGVARRVASRPVYGDPFGVFGRDIDRVFGSIFGRGALASTPVASSDEAAKSLLNPRIDVHETETEIELSAELPGVEQDDVDVSVLDGILTVTGEKKAARDSNEGARVVERSYGSFKRSFRLPDNVQADDISASFKNGVLSITLPKVAEVKPEPRKIAISG